MLELVQLLIAQAQTTVPSAPTTVDPLTALLGQGGAAGGVILIGQLIITELRALREKRRNGGRDHEREAKETTRSKIHDIADSQAELVDRLRETAQIQRETLKELEETRRENREAHRVLGDQIAHHRR